ncbi:hypothetical protein CMU04_06325 [Elizabethkingia anophelis]|nr:hypothetical protein [Elizabethkingia anophelis]
MDNNKGARIIELFVKPTNQERHDKKEAARELSIKQKNCGHKFEIDEEDEVHNCMLCGKPFTSHDLLIYVLYKRETQLTSYNLRNEIYYLTEKRDKIKQEIKVIQKEKRLIIKSLK